jgi:glycosyltransferase AcbS
VNIVECHFELGGFNDRLVRGGISVYLWNLCRQFSIAGHQVTGLTASHGLLPELRKYYDVQDLDWKADARVPVRLDPSVWTPFPSEVNIAASFTALRFRVADVDLIVLDGGPLRDHSATFYPPYEFKGRDLSFLKPLVFQVMAARFLADTVAPGTVVHLHEPYYHYLIPATLKGSGVVTISTVQSNMPVNKKVYGPEVRTLLAYLGADATLADGLVDDLPDTTLNRSMRSYLPATLLYNDYPERLGHDYISVLGLLLRSVDALDFLSPGQLEHVVTQADTPFQQLFEHSPSGSNSGRAAIGWSSVAAVSRMPGLRRNAPTNGAARR